MRSAMAIGLFVAVPLFAQSSVSVKQPSTNAQTASTATPAPAPFKVRCLTCESEIEGKLSVSSDGVEFCCTGFKADGEIVTAKCPYSFRVAVADVKQQLLETPEDGDHVWHVVTNDKEHYAFVSSERESVDAAYNWFGALSKKIISSKFLEKYSAELAKITHAPKIERSTPCK